MNTAWDKLVSENLLNSNLFSGVCLLSNEKTDIYSWGNLTQLSQVDIATCFAIFCNSESCGSFSVTVVDDKEQIESFNIYHKTHISIYGTSTGKKCGIIVSRLQHGLLVATFTNRVQSHQAISAVERFTGMLRF